MKFLAFIDSFLNKIPMYKVIVLSLIILCLISFYFSLTRSISYSMQALLISLLLIVFVCFVSNIFFSKIFKAPTNVDSFLITALILFLIMPPVEDFSSSFIYITFGVFAMASKFIFAVNKKHIFNPAAIAAVVSGIIFETGAIWWVATPVFLPFTAALGLLIVRKIRRFEMFFAFFIPALVILTLVSVSGGISLTDSIEQAFTAWPLVFFGAVMFTEPRTMPPNRRNQIIFGILVGLIFAFPFKIGPLASTPELALLIGNIFAFWVSARRNFLLTLSEKTKIAQSIYGFSFAADYKPDFKPGQYLEWTVPHKRPDFRGNRRFFTIASSPTEEDLQLGVKISEKSSSFKKSLLGKAKGDTITAGLLAGDFLMPDDQTRKLVFIAGGIGITPFRSMVKYIIDTKQKRDIILFYAVSDPSEFVYKEIFEKAGYSHFLKTVYVITHAEKAPSSWQGEKGHLTPEMIRQHVPDFHKRLFYLSGPAAMVHGYKELLEGMGVKRTKIITDYFPGF